MTDAIKEKVLSEGKKLKWYHFSNEADMLNRIVLGMTSKKYREKYDLKKDEVRDYIPKCQLESLKHLQRLNTDLIHSGLDYQERKEILSRRYEKMYNELKLNE